MAGFLRSRAHMIVCRAEKPSAFDMDKLRSRAFNPEMTADNVRYGWVDMEDPLETGAFSLAMSDGRFSGFSYRKDTKKVPAGAIRLHVTEKIRQETQGGIKIGRKRKKEIKEQVTDLLTSKAEFVPAITDCIWDGEKGRLFVGTSSRKAASEIVEYFNASFDMNVYILEPSGDMSEILKSIIAGRCADCAGYSLAYAGSASLHTSKETDERKSVCVQNSVDAVIHAVEEGLDVTKLNILASTEQGEELDFVLDASLAASGVKFPAHEKGAEEENAFQEGSFLVNADICAKIADIVESLCSQERQ